MTTNAETAVTTQVCRVCIKASTRGGLGRLDETDG
jgi:hypothetical protein